MGDNIYAVGRLNCLYSFNDPIISQEFFVFTALGNDSMSIVTLVLAILYGIVLFSISLISISFNHTTEQWIMTLFSLIACSGVGISGGLLSYIQFKNYQKSQVSSRWQTAIPTLQAIFICSSTVYNVLFACMRIHTDSCASFPAGVQRFICTGYDNKNGPSFYVLLVGILYTPILLMGCLRETRLWLILSSILAHDASFAALSISDGESDVGQLIIFWGIMAIAICIDIHRANIDRFLKQKKLQEAAASIERMQVEDSACELRHMIGNVAHDLKTPLASFTTGIDLITLSLEELSRQVEVLKDIQNDAKKQDQDEESDSSRKSRRSPYDISLTKVFTNKALEIINEMIASIHSSLVSAKDSNAFMLMSINRSIDYTKASKGIQLTPKYETVNVMQAIKLPLDCMRNVQERMELQFAPLSTEICSHLITDKQWLQENLLCLLSNAVKYSSQGPVTIQVTLQSKSLLLEKIAQKNIGGFLLSSLSSETTTAVKNPSKKLLSAVDEEEKVLLFQVEDHGIGLTPSDMTTVFLPFKQAQRLAGGTGLGLFSLAKRMDALKGFYGVENRHDGQQGCLFWFAIPYRPDTFTISMMSISTASLSNSSSSSSSASASTSGSKENTPRCLKTVSIVDLNISPAIIQLSKKSLLSSVSSPLPQLAATENMSTTSTAITNIHKTAGSSSVKSAKRDDPKKVHKKWKILLVDDSPLILKMVGLMLKRQGHQVHEAENGAVAVKKLEVEGEPNAGKGSYELILMDLQMPVMDGLEATRRIRMMEQEGAAAAALATTTSKPPIVIIGMSANSDDETMQEAFRAGVNGFIPKPFTMDMFSQTAEKYLPNTIQ